MNNQNPEESNFLLYSTPEGDVNLNVLLHNETIWLSQQEMQQLFDRAKSTISEHISNIFEENELNEKVVVRDFRTTTQHGAITGKTQVTTTKYYNLDVIISVGYRVKSQRGTQFRIWSTQRLKEYIIKGFTMDDVRLKQGGYKSRYFEELLERIRDIRSSERMLYQKVTDIYATSIDYRKDAKETELFFKTVQNKMHFAISGKTAAEIIAERADSKKPLMGLTNFSGIHPIQRDIYIAKII